jgi:hypothetical protein
MPHPGFLVGGEEMRIFLKKNFFVGDPLALYVSYAVAAEKRKEGRKEQ